MNPLILLSHHHIRHITVAGVMLPLPIAAVIEVIVDPTNHNLIPFEIILYWLPAFALAWAGAFFGSAMRKQLVRS